MALVREVVWTSEQTCTGRGGGDKELDELSAAVVVATHCSRTEEIGSGWSDGALEGGRIR